MHIMKITRPAAALAAGVLLAGLVAVAAAPRAAHAESLLTTFAGGNGQNGNMFDLTAATDLTITGFAIHAEVTGPYDMQVYYRLGSFLGFEQNAGAWTLLGQQEVTGAGSSQETALTIGGLQLLSGQTYGLYIVNADTVNDNTLSYTDGDTVFSDANLTFTPGIGLDYGTDGFNGGTFSPRIWNGRINYTVNSTAVPEPGSLALALPGLALVGAVVVARRRRGTSAA